MDFYTFANRELVRADLEQRRTIVRSQLGFGAIVYGIALPVFPVVFATGMLPWTLAGWFYALVVLEHVGLEVNRALLALADQTAAAAVLFIRQAIVPLAVVPAMLAAPALRHLETVLGTWVGFDALAVCVGVQLVRRHLRGQQRGRVDWAWIRRGTRTCFLFLVATLCTRFLFTADRQIVNHFDSLVVVAAYTFFFNIGNAIGTVSDVVLYQFAYPELVRTAHRREMALFRRQLTRLSVQAVALTAAAGLASILAGPIVIRWVGGGVYAEYQWALVPLVIVMCVYNLSVVPHYGLYSLGADRAIVLLAIAATGAFVGTAALLLLFGNGAMVAVIAALGSASLVLLVGKTIVLQRSLANAE
jgi:O-antigen/teichoic acid export membrane protein